MDMFCNSPHAIERVIERGSEMHDVSFVIPQDERVINDLSDLEFNAITRVLKRGGAGQIAALCFFEMQRARVRCINEVAQKRTKVRVVGRSEESFADFSKGAHTVDVQHSSRRGCACTDFM